MLNNKIIEQMESNRVEPKKNAVRGEDVSTKVSEIRNVSNQNICKS